MHHILYKCFLFELQCKRMQMGEHKMLPKSDAFLEKPACVRLAPSPHSRPGRLSFSQIKSSWRGTQLSSTAPELIIEEEVGRRDCDACSRCRPASGIWRIRLSLSPLQRTVIAVQEPSNKTSAPPPSRHHNCSGTKAGTSRHLLMLEVNISRLF